MKKNMDNPQKDLICKHTACDCQVSGNNEFCSKLCENSNDPDVCPCEHEHCNEGIEDNEE